MRTLEYAVSDEVRSQDSWTLIALLLSRRETQDQAWEFVQQHWAEIERKATVNSGARIVEATGAFCTVERRDEVASFFAAHPVSSAERTLAKSTRQASTTASICARRRSRSCASGWTRISKTLDIRSPMRRRFSGSQSGRTFSFGRIANYACCRPSICSIFY
jgi:hypothetical protein